MRTILASFVRHWRLVKQDFKHEHLSNQRPNSLGNVFTEQVDRFLARNGYTREDIQIWASALATKRVSTAVQKLFQSESATHRPLPVSLLLLFLRRNDLGPTSVRHLVEYSWRRTTSNQVAVTSIDAAESSQSLDGVTPSPLDETTLFTLIVRLLRHARRALPEAFVIIAAIFTDGVGQCPISSVGPTDSDKLARLESLYNRVLALISLPSPQAPFHSVQHQERAQFDVLQNMAAHKPPIGVTREGYRAIVAVQLANKKTAQERDWASLKSLSWPPWKEDKTGFDVEKGPGYGTSRASTAVKRMLEAGYGVARWDKVAGIFAGWDLDGSPTIQTRASHLHEAQVKPLREPSPKEKKFPSQPVEEHKSVWVGRIRATRTVQESWACFLSYTDMRAKPDQDVYHAMFEKIHAENIRQRKQQRTEQPGILRQDTHKKADFVGGDGREVMAVPTSPKEGTYVRSEPVTIERLALDMVRAGVYPTGNCLAFLIHTAPSILLGLRYLRWGTNNDNALQSLLSRQPADDPRLEKVPQTILAAFLSFLCKFPHRHFVLQKGETPDVPLLQHAVRLLQARRPRYRPAWQVVLATLASNRKIYLGPSPFSRVNANPVERYSIMQRILREHKGIGLEPDASTFMTMCTGLEKAILHALLQQSTSTVTLSLSSYSISMPGIEPVPVLTPSKILDDSMRTDICRQFYTLMGAPPVSGLELIPATPPEDDSPPAEPIVPLLPTLLASPHGQVLHGLIRVLGLLPHCKGLVELLRWMVVHREEINKAAEMPRNGLASRRRALVAARVFCQRSWRKRFQAEVAKDGQVTADTREEEENDAESRLGSGVLAVEGPAGPRRGRRTTKKLRDLIESVEEWGGWPTDAECEAYVGNRHFPKD